MRTTGSNQNITWLEVKEGQKTDGSLEYEQVYPCRCGATHRGEYAIYDYGHHMCFHDAPLVWIIKGVQAMCSDCGKTFGFNEDDLRRHRSEVSRLKDTIERLRSTIDRARFNL